MTAAGRDAIVSVARNWIGTPYRHQASRAGAGADCLGLVRGIWREVYGREPVTVPAYTPDWTEPSGDEALWRAARRHLRQCDSGEEPRPGDLLLFRMREGRVAKHLGILSCIGDRPAFIHAMSGHGVIESPLSTPWARRVVARFVFPEKE
ncbi:MAG: NlpC/P60 family protein [Pseudomonadota bacterium]